MPRSPKNAGTLTENQAQKYITFLRKRGAVIIEPSKIDIFTSAVSERSILFKANEWVSQLKKYRGQEPPYFFLLNLGVDENSEKHAIVVAFEPNPETGVCHIHYFDSNGAINYEKAKDLPLKRGLRIFAKILAQMEVLLKKNFHCKKIEVHDDMDGRYSMNVVDDGNCNALSIWYITKRFLHGEGVEEDIAQLAEKIENEPRPVTYKINEDILFLGTLPARGEICRVEGTFYQ